jgi:hypothetical protein
MSVICVFQVGLASAVVKNLVHPSTGHEIETDQIHEMRPEMITAPRLLFFIVKKL